MCIFRNTNSSLGNSDQLINETNLTSVTLTSALFPDIGKTLSFRMSRVAMVMVAMELKYLL